MAMTDEEILSAAARLRAARRRRMAKTCEACGTPFEGVAQRRYCSDACRMRASRRRNAVVASADDPIRALLRARGALDPDPASLPAPQAEDESDLDYLDRVREHISRGRVFDDSVEVIRQMREERDAELDRAIGGRSAVGE